MKRRNIFIGDTPVKVNEESTGGEFADLDGERFYKISNFDLMPDFFMSIVSASDLWMFISSNGSLTAGRKNSEGALFPYYPEDKIHDYRDITGSKTIILVKHDSTLKLWEPLGGKQSGVYTVRRNIYKNLYGNKLIFEEINEDLSLIYRYAWTNCDRFGFIKSSKLINQGSNAIEVEVLDGLQNILPSEVDSGMQSSSSNLMDAYKRQELVPDVSLGIYRLSSVPSDTAEPSEALKVNTVWSEGLEEAKILLSSLQLDSFCSGFQLETEHDIKATRGAYFLNAKIEISGGEEKEWNIVAELNQDAADLSALLLLLRSETALRILLNDEIYRSSEELKVILAASDAIQCTNDELSTSRHLTNVLFNVMRGGIFTDHYSIHIPDLLSFIAGAHKSLDKQVVAALSTADERIQYHELIERVGKQENPDLTRLCYEYLALTFSRRHGDPSRPWNRFSIENRKEDGSKNLDYEGNWRDIFQNWEALSLSFPGYIESMICKFVSASTPDGYNPYRITRKGIDWEVPDPSDPWSNIGYWGDHQIVYLLKFLKLSVDHHPGQLHLLLSQDLFSYANVPYRIKPYEELLIDPRDTIVFDSVLVEKIGMRVKAMGSDGKLVWDENDQVMHVNLAEKLFVTLLSKLSNFIPGAGIWMNTQRPEWNDANNALVGSGVSMVTTYYLRAFLKFCMDLFRSYTKEFVRISEEVAGLLLRIDKIVKDQLLSPETMLTERGMKACLDLLGEAGSEYRQGIYVDGFSGRRVELRKDQILEFIDRALLMLEITIESNARSDQLYHSYNLMRVEEDQLFLRRLYEMLEGQVAVLSSGVLSPEEAVELLDALKSSKLFREDQSSYILYPNRILPSFTEKNKIPSGLVERSVLLKTLVDSSNEQILVKDLNGEYHFNGNLRNSGFLKEALDKLPGHYAKLVSKETQLILDTYEQVFDHQSFTGRSGTFYGYEGLGSIYWHMVSKLLLAVCESYYRAIEETDDETILSRFAEHYFEIRAGIGLHKNPALYGAFPIDPYSHTPGNKGAQQPGMTGQVKEDILARWGELGIRVYDGRIHFQPVLLRRREFLEDPGTLNFISIAGEKQSIGLDPGMLGFTYCQVPVIYRISREEKVDLYLTNGSRSRVEGLSIDAESSESLFLRDGLIARIEVWLYPRL